MKRATIRQLQVELRYLAVATMIVLAARYLGATRWAAAHSAQLNYPRTPIAQPTASRPRGDEFDCRNVKTTIRDLAEKIGPRPAGSSGEKQAAKYIYQNLLELGYKTSFSPPIALPGRPGHSQNVIAIRPDLHQGKWAIVVAAHYDSKAADCPAANDNGSGTSVLLEIARVLAQRELPYQLVLLFDGGEEHLAGVNSPSLLGSRAFVADYKAHGDKEIAAMINVDMVGVGQRLYIQAVGPGGPKLRAIIADSAHKLCLPLSNYRGPHGSDHIPFGWVGIPAIWLQRLPAPRRDTPSDQVQYIQDDALTEVGQLLIDVLTGLTEQTLDELKD